MTSLDFFLQQLINSLSLGAIYGLIAIGYTMVYGILGMINFAHGDVFMVGAFTAMIAFMVLALYPVLPVAAALLTVLILTTVLTSVWSWSLERIAYRPLRGSFRLAPLITAIGLSIAIQNFVSVFQGPRPKSMPDVIVGRWQFPGLDVTIQYKQFLVVAVTVLLLAIFSWIVTRTSLGRAQRACSQDRKMTSLVGINVNRTISTTFIMGGMLAGIAGTVYVFYYPSNISYMDGFLPGIKAFTAAVLGGIGSLPGAVIGGLLIALIEVLWGSYTNYPEYKDVAAFAVLIVVLIFMPSGILGRPEVEKV